jgi:lysozyme
MTREALRKRATTGMLAAATVVVAFAFVSGLRLPGLGTAITAPAATAPAATAPAATAPAATAPATTAPAPKRMSDSGLARIRQSEAFIARVYDDGAGNLTIGYGHLIRPGEHFSGTMTQAQADTLFRQDVARVVNPALDRITIDLTQNQIDALGSFIFNVGTGGFLKNILSYLNSGNLEDATSHMLQFITGRDLRSGRRKVLRGLLTRRQFEVALFKNPVPLQYLKSLLPGS